MAFKGSLLADGMQGGCCVYCLMDVDGESVLQHGQINKMVPNELHAGGRMAVKMKCSRLCICCHLSSIQQIWHGDMEESQSHMLDQMMPEFVAKEWGRNRRAKGV